MMDGRTAEERRKAAYAWCADAIAIRMRNEAQLDGVQVMVVLKALRAAAEVPPIDRKPQGDA